MTIELTGKKMLILGAYRTEIEIVNAAKQRGIYTIVTDSHTNFEDAPAKFLADEAWNVSWTDIDVLARMCKVYEVDGCLAGFSENRVRSASQLCSAVGYPFYTNGSNLNVILDKIAFREACKKNEIQVAKAYEYGDVVSFPVIVKPSDSGGSRGITICHHANELDEAYQKALAHSASGRVVIEQYIVADEVMIYYIVREGQSTLSAMCDRMMKRFDRRVTQLPVGYYYPSKYLEVFKKKFDFKYRKLIRNLGIKNGLIAFQSFVYNDDFIPFDPTYRLDGTLAHHLTERMNGDNALDMLICHSLTGSMINTKKETNPNSVDAGYIGFQLPILLGKGVITHATGFEEVLKMAGVIHIFTALSVGDTCDKTADFSQIFCRIYMCVKKGRDLLSLVKRIQETVDVYDEKGRSMVINSFDKIVFTPYGI